ncbi:IS3 family transposase, partial [Streptococcus pneumoniae]|nr:IS3 family transposase [Streptococcus pneumoniae]
MMESFFGILKSEMFYGYEKNFRSLEIKQEQIFYYKTHKIMVFNTVLTPKN